MRADAVCSCTPSWGTLQPVALHCRRHGPDNGGAESFDRGEHEQDDRNSRKSLDRGTHEQDHRSPHQPIDNGEWRPLRSPYHHSRQPVHGSPQDAVGDGDQALQRDLVLTSPSMSG